MNSLYISSKQNNFVKYIRSLREKRNRETEGCYVVEGAKSVYEALSAGIFFEKLIISERGEKQPLVKDILARIDKTVQVIRVTDEVMDYMAETETPQGVMLVLPLPVIGLTEIPVSNTSMFVVIDGVQDPGNVGTIIRTADAFGVQAVILTKGCADVFNSKTLRSTMGSVFHIPVLRDVDISDLITYLKDNSILIAATTLEEKSISLTDIDFSGPAALVFGSEGKGVSTEITAKADVLTKIPIPGSAESLNVAVASGIVLYEASRRRGSSINQTCK